MTTNRQKFTVEFKRDAAALVVEQGCSVQEACRAMGVSETAMRRWISQLKLALEGYTPESKALTREQQIIQVMEKKIKRRGTI
jgi:transposase